jgi:hypothetical protein
MQFLWKMYHSTIDVCDSPDQAAHYYILGPK